MRSMHTSASAPNPARHPPAGWSAAMGAQMRFFLLAGVILTVGLSVAEAQEREFGAKIGPSFSVVLFDPDEGGE